MIYDKDQAEIRVFERPQGGAVSEIGEAPSNEQEVSKL
jgi:hypothetical protein